MAELITLQEKETSKIISLKNIDIHFINTRLQNKIKLETISQTDFKIKATHHVGSIRFPSGDYLININPKINDLNFFKMLTISKMVPAQFLDIVLKSKPGDTFLDLLSMLFIQDVNSIIATGIYRNYISVSEETTSIKGRLLIVKNIRSSKFIITKPWCEYDELSFDVIENQCILFCTNILLGMVVNNELRKQLVTIRNMLLSQGVTLNEIKFYDVNNIMLQRLNKTYESVIELCKFIISRFWYQDFSQNKFPIPAFFIDMNILFQEFVVNLIKSELIKKGFSVSSQEKNPNILEKILQYDIDEKSLDVPPIKPDIIIQKNNKKLVIDTKYKEDEPTSGDFYQATAYSLVHDCDTLLLLPKKTRDLSDGFIIQQHDSPNKNKIHVKTVDFKDSEDFVSNTRNQILDIIFKII